MLDHVPITNLKFDTNKFFNSFIFSYNDRSMDVFFERNRRYIEYNNYYTFTSDLTVLNGERRNRMEDIVGH
jgi:hypothetical protein